MGSGIPCPQHHASGDHSWACSVAPAGSPLNQHFSGPIHSGDSVKDCTRGTGGCGTILKIDSHRKEAWRRQLSCHQPLLFSMDVTWKAQRWPASCPADELSAGFFLFPPPGTPDSSCAPAGLSGFRFPHSSPLPPSLPPAPVRAHSVTSSLLPHPPGNSVKAKARVGGPSPQPPLVFLKLDRVPQKQVTGYSSSQALPRTEV